MSRTLPIDCTKRWRHPELFPFKIEVVTDDAHRANGIDLLYSLHSISKNPEEKPIELIINDYVIGKFTKEYIFSKPLNVRGAMYSLIQTSQPVLMKGEAVFNRDALMSLDETTEIMGETFRSYRGSLRLIQKLKIIKFSVLVKESQR